MAENLKTLVLLKLLTTSLTPVSHSATASHHHLPKSFLASCLPLLLGQQATSWLVPSLLLVLNGSASASSSVSPGSASAPPSGCPHEVQWLCSTFRLSIWCPLSFVDLYPLSLQHLHLGANPYFPVFPAHTWHRDCGTYVQRLIST